MVKYHNNVVKAYKADKMTISDGLPLYQQRFYTSVQEVFQDAKDKAMLEVYRNNPGLREKVEHREALKTLSKAGVGRPGIRERVQEIITISK